ncbi:MAG: RNA methyltransferase [Methanophagales archaeon]|nr:RNA methyltransferase [Methanophagales archaeon]
MEIRTILVEPKNEENIGAVARVLKNFGCSALYLVNPADIGDKAVSVASHAYDVLRTSEIVGSIEEAIENSVIVVGTTSKYGISVNRHLRIPFFSPQQLKEKVKRIGEDKGKDNSSKVVSILFGREDTGLKNEELMLCDIVVCIPTSLEYPVMNLSHAVAVVLYELSGMDTGMTSASRAIRLASVEDKERLFMHVETFLDEIGYKEHKKEKTLLMLRRILGRAELTGREVQTLHGIIRKAEWKIGKRSNLTERDVEAFVELKKINR